MSDHRWPSRMMAALAKRCHACWHGACQACVERLVSAAGGRAVNIGAGERFPEIRGCDAIGDGLDFNTDSLPYPTDYADTVICEQVIEHLHNVRWFARELYRITAPGGRLILATECLDAMPNVLALLLGHAPFSCQPLDGWYTDGWNDRPLPDKGVALNSRVRSGVAGHVRVMTSRQLLSVLRWAGWRIESVERFGLGYFAVVQAQRGSEATP